MSDLAEKFEQRKPSAGDRAQASRKQLLARWGSAQLSPELIEIDSVCGREVWRRVGSKGDVFQQEPR